MPAVIKILAIDYAGDELVVGPLPYITIVTGTILFSGLTVFISTRKPIKKASRVSPVEAFRYVEYGTLNIKKIKKTNGTVISRLARNNTQRSKKRTARIVVSLALSIILLNSVFIFAGSFDENVYIQKQTRSDFIIYNKDLSLVAEGFNGHENGLPEQVIMSIESRPGVYNEAKMYRNTYDDENIACDWGIPYSIDNTYREALQIPESLDLGIYQDSTGNHYAALTKDHLPLGNIFGVSETLIEKIDILEGEKDASALKEKMYGGNNVILITSYNEAGKVYEPVFEDLRVGDTIQFYEEGIPSKTFEIVAIAAATSGETTITGGGANLIGSIGGPQIFMSEDNFKELYKTPTLYSFLFDVDEEYQDDMEKYLAEYTLQNPEVLYTSAATLGASVTSIKNVCFLVGGLIGAIFAFVGIINFANLIMTSIISRKHELVIMQSIGMTVKQLRKMLIEESLFYVLRSGIVGTVLSLVLGLTLLKILVERGPFHHMMAFHMTIFPSIFLTIIFVVLALAIPSITFLIFYQRSVIEQFRLTE